MKFTTKLTLVILLAAMLPVALLGYALSLLNARTLRQTAQETYILAAERVQERLGEQVQANTSFLGNVAAVFGNRNLEEGAAMQVVRELLAGETSVYAIGVYDVRGELVDVISKSRSNTTPSAMPASLALGEQLASSNATFAILSPMTVVGAKMPAIPLVTPLTSDGKRIGYCAVMLETEVLCDIVESSSRRIFAGAPDRITLATDSLVIIAANNRNDVQSAKNLSTRVPTLQKSTTGFVGTLQEYTGADAVPMLGAAMSLPLLRSIVMVEEPQETAYRSITRLRWNTLWWTLGSGVLAAFVCMLLAKQLSKPIGELSNAASRLATRDFTFMLPQTRSDEFGQLFQQHNSVVRELAKYEALNVHRIIAERNKLETIVRQATDGIMLLDAEKRIVMLNAIWATWFGVDTSKEGLLMEDVFAVEDLTRLVGDILQTQEITRPCELRLRKDGEIRELVLRGTIVKIQYEGKLLALMLLLRDATHDVETDRMKTELVAIVAHELRSPLNSINGLAELIGEGVLPPEEVEEYGRTIASQSRKLAGIISKFLDLNRMESGKAEVRRIPVRVDEIIRSVVAINLPIATKKQIRVEMQLPATAPPVLGDPDLIGQAVLNLFSNAVKYSSPETTITLELRTKAEEIVITVRDQGFGISESSQAKLFTKFFRATDDPRVRADAGTGLGLAFAKEIVQQHGGKIGMESHLNAGSTFWFSLPI